LRAETAGVRRYESGDRCNMTYRESVKAAALALQLNGKSLGISFLLLYFCGWLD
jgi:hypothetical protein